MDRYTSPETSRALAEAFSDRDSRDFSSSGAWWRRRGGPPTLHTSTVSRPRCYENEGEADLEAVRALDLTDVLRELTRPRPEEADARPLCIRWDLTTAPDLRGNEAYVCGAMTRGGGIPASCWAGSAVEAAALMLLALLRERAK